MPVVLRSWRGACLRTQPPMSAMTVGATAGGAAVAARGSGLWRRSDYDPERMMSSNSSASASAPESR